MLWYDIFMQSELYNMIDMQNGELAWNTTSGVCMEDIINDMWNDMICMER